MVDLITSGDQWHWTFLWSYSFWYSKLLQLDFLCSTPCLSDLVVSNGANPVDLFTSGKKIIWSYGHEFWCSKATLVLERRCSSNFHILPQVFEPHISQILSNKLIKITNIIFLGKIFLIHINGKLKVEIEVGWENFACSV